MVEGFDPTIDGITAPVTSAFNAYVRDELGFEIDLRYQLLNQKISRDWDWQSGAGIPRSGRSPEGVDDPEPEPESIDRPRLFSIWSRRTSRASKSSIIWRSTTPCGAT